MHEPVSVHKIANEIGYSTRHAYRAIQDIKELGFVIDSKTSNKTKFYKISDFPQSIKRLINEVSKKHNG